MNRITVPNLLKRYNLVSSTSEAMRLIDGGGIKVDGEKFEDLKKLILGISNYYSSG